MTLNGFFATRSTEVVLVPRLQASSAGLAPGPEAAPQKFFVIWTTRSVWFRTPQFPDGSLPKMLFRLISLTGPISQRPGPPLPTKALPLR